MTQNYIYIDNKAIKENTIPGVCIEYVLLFYPVVILTE